MTDSPVPNKSLHSAKPRHSRARKIVLSLLAIVLVFAVALGITAIILWRHMQPFLRARLVDTLAARFHASVQLDQFQASASHGFSVSGGGLRIIPHGLEQFPPVISVEHFSFHMDPAQLFSAKRHVRMVQVDGMHIVLPPKAERPHLLDNNGGQKDKPARSGIVHPALYFDEILATNSSLTLETDKPGHRPLEFDISSVKLLTRWNTGQMHYVADLRNAKPVGDIHAEGDIGPWIAQQPRNTHVTGDYTFNHADLATTKGITGILASTGHFAGPLDNLTVDGRADVPNFSLDEARHPIALFTTYHAIVDGTNGDTYLQPVHAHFRNTWFTCVGKVVRAQPHGHDIQLQVTMDRGRIEDMLWLAVKAPTPVITGNVKMEAAMDLPPDPGATAEKRLDLKGKITITQMHFSDPGTDKKIDSISLRTQGEAKQAKELSKTPGPDNISLDGRLFGNFTLQHGNLNLSPANFQLPGVDATLHGDYTLNSEQFDFSGDVKLQATVSQMFTGWKSVLLKPIDPLFKKNGAGTYLPFKLSGTKNSPTVGIEIGGHELDIHPKHGH